MRNSSSTEAKANSGTLRRRFASSTAGSGSSHSDAPPFGRHALRGQRPRRRFEDVPVARIAMRERVLEIVGERPHLPLLDELDRRRGNHLVVVVDELRDRVFDVARAGLEDHVALAHALVRRHVLDQHHHAPAEVAGEQVVEILERAGAEPRIARGAARARTASMSSAEYSRPSSRKMRSIARSCFSFSARASSDSAVEAAARRTGCDAASARRTRASSPAGSAAR